MPSLGVFAQGSPAKLYLPVRNGTAAVVSAGAIVGFPGGGNSVGGTVVVLMDTDVAANLPGFCGVVDADLADGGYGQVQKFGYCASILFSHTGTSATITAGDVLVPSPVAGGVHSASAPTYALSGFKFITAADSGAATSVTGVSARGYIQGIIRCT